MCWYCKAFNEVFERTPNRVIIEMYGSIEQYDKEMKILLHNMEARKTHAQQVR